ncbi:PHP domain-containing protein [Clostridium paraputrificum]|uniref:PHP domain-containing protein n=1 Tax=Clostridium TaxID=1485 RepID=UPI003D34B90F
MIKTDFHTHTTSSDGILSPKEMVQRAFHNDVKYLAITDHDTISGLEEALDEAKKLNIKLIPGVELSTNHNKESIHILGFFKDDSYKNPEFTEYLQTLKDKRKIRAERMVEKLKEVFNIEISIENVLNRGKDVVARPHIAQEIISAGYPYETEYIFQNFIGKDCPAFVPTNKLSTEDGVKLLKKYNASVFLAHPIFIKKSPLEDFLTMDFDGIEAIYFQNTKEEEDALINFAIENNLLVSGGSDCHGDLVGDLRHGDIGCMTMPEDFMDNILNNIL